MAEVSSLCFLLLKKRNAKCNGDCVVLSQVGFLSCGRTLLSAFSSINFSVADDSNTAGLLTGSVRMIS